MFADKTVDRAASHTDVYVFSEQIRVRRVQADDPVAGAVAIPAIFFFGFTVDVDFKSLAGEALQRLRLNGTLLFLQQSEAPALLFFGYGAGHVRRGSIRPGRILEGIDAVVFHCIEQ